MLARIAWFYCAVGMVAVVGATASACPFCEATAPTWLQSIREADAAVIGKVRKVEPTAGDQVVTTLRAHYDIAEILQGKNRLTGQRQLNIETLEAPTQNARCLMTAVGNPDLSWSTLVELTETRATYLASARKLPASGLERWNFFYRFLEHADEEIAADAYGEFAAASFAEVKAFAPHADRRQLWRWVESEKTPESRRGLYYTLLGLCGDKTDAQKLMAMMQSPATRPPGAFSALVACYISLCGEPGLRYVEKHLLHDRVSEEDGQAVVVALRFHGEEQHVLKRERVALAMRRLLERKDLAGSVIPDLARWQDWQCLPRIVQLFHESSGSDSWLRIPVVAYLKVCPLEEAKQSLAKLKQLDPQAVEQAEALSLFGAQLRPATTDE